MRNVIKIALKLKIAFFAAQPQNCPAAGGSLFNPGPKFDKSCAKKSLGPSPPLLAKLWLRDRV